MQPVNRVICTHYCIPQHDKSCSLPSILTAQGFLFFGTSLYYFYYPLIVY